MKWIRTLALLASCTMCMEAESLNVVHLGPPRDIEFEVTAGKIHQKFTLPRLAATGRFLVPADQSATVETLGELKISLKLPPSKQARIAVIHPADDSYGWRICESKATAGKFTMRLVNLAREATTVTIRKQVLTVPAGADLPLSPPARTLTTADGEKATAPKNDEPGAVIAFLLKQDGKWQVHFVADI